MFQRRRDDVEKRMATNVEKSMAINVEKRTAKDAADSVVKVLLVEAVANLQFELHDRDQEHLDNDMLIINVGELLRSGQNSM